LTPIGTHVNEQPCCFDHGDRPPQLFYSGPLNYRYGLPEMINALKKLRDAGHTFHATFSGEGPSVHDLRQQVNTLKLESHVHFVPPIQSMLSGSDAFKAVLQTVDIFIQPWPSSAWRPELLEAMSVGNAVVAVGGVENDLIIEQKTALTIPYHDDHALFEKLDFLLKNRTSARDLACQSQNYLRKHFLVSRMITRLTKAYRLARQLKTT